MDDMAAVKKEPVEKPSAIRTGYMIHVGVKGVQLV
jgi:hypothetical protein